MKRNLLIVVLGTATLASGFYAAYRLGKHQERRITYLSELSAKARLIPVTPGVSEKPYVLNFEVVCPNGKDIGRLAIDFNLSNGKWVVVRNDSQLEPNCDR